MNGRLSGTRVLVTGSSKGIGRGIALRLAQDGADVVVNYNSDPGGAEAAVTEIRALGRQAVALTESLALEVARDNILVNAIAPGPIVPPPDMSQDEIDEVAKATPVGHWGGEDEIAKAVVLLCQTDFITGETIRVDGGRHLA